MATITSYAELQASIADFLNRDDLTAVIPTFVVLAESQISRDVNHWRQEKRVEVTLDERFEILPDDWLEGIRIALPSGQALRLINRDQMAEMRANNEDTAGTPCFFCYNAGEIEFYPTPTDNFVISMVYRASTPILGSNGITTNWILDGYPDLMLYGALVQATLYLKDTQATQVYLGAYTSIIASMNSESKRGMASGSTLVMRNRK